MSTNAPLHRRRGIRWISCTSTFRKGEADLAEQSSPILDRSVARILIGTHSRDIDGRIVTAPEGSLRDCRSNASHR